MRSGIRAFSPSMSRATDGTEVVAPADTGALEVACFALFLLLAIGKSTPFQLYLFCASDTSVCHLRQLSLAEFALTNAIKGRLGVSFPRYSGNRARQPLFEKPVAFDTPWTVDN